MPKLPPKTLTPYQYDTLYKLAKDVVGAYDYTPGSSDLDDEQTTCIFLTLGQWRRTRQVLYTLDEPSGQDHTLFKKGA